MGEGGKAAERTPDALGKSGLVDVAHGALRNVQMQQANLRAEIAMNGLRDDAIAPSATNRTVAEQREFLRKAEERVVAEFADVMDDVREAIKLREDQEAAARATAASTR